MGLYIIYNIYCQALPLRQKTQVLRCFNFTGIAPVVNRFSCGSQNLEVHWDIDLQFFFRGNPYLPAPCPVTLKTQSNLNLLYCLSTKETSSILWAIPLWNLNGRKRISGVFTEEKEVLGGMELAIHSNRTDLSGCVVSCWGSRKGERYSYHLSEQCFRSPWI